MTTIVDYARLRADVGASREALDDIEAAAIYVEAGEVYTSEAALKAQTRVLAIQRILASAVKLTTYRQNNTQENLSDIAKNLKILLDYWTHERDIAITIVTTTSNGNGSVQIRAVAVW